MMHMKELKELELCDEILNSVDNLLKVDFLWERDRDHKINETLGVSNDSILQDALSQSLYLVISCSTQPLGIPQFFYSIGMNNRPSPSCRP